MESVTTGLRGHPVPHILSQYRGAGVASTPCSRARNVDRLRVLIYFDFCPRCPLAGVMASWGVAGTHVKVCAWHRRSWCLPCSAKGRAVDCFFKHLIGCWEWGRIVHKRCSGKMAKSRKTRKSVLPLLGPGSSSLLSGKKSFTWLLLYTALCL